MHPGRSCPEASGPECKQKDSCPGLFELAFGIIVDSEANEMLCLAVFGVTFENFRELG